MKENVKQKTSKSRHILHENVVFLIVEVNENRLVAILLHATSRFSLRFHFYFS